MIPNWIFDYNLKPFLEILARFCIYEIDDGDWDAIYSGSKKTDFEQDIWFEYEYTGSLPVKFSVAQDIGCSVIFVDVQAKEEVQAKVAVAIEILQFYRLTR